MKAPKASAWRNTISSPLVLLPGLMLIGFIAIALLFKGIAGVGPQVTRMFAGLSGAVVPLLRLFLEFFGTREDREEQHYGRSLERRVTEWAKRQGWKLIALKDATSVRTPFYGTDRRDIFDSVVKRQQGPSTAGWISLRSKGKSAEESDIAVVWRDTRVVT